MAALFALLAAAATTILVTRPIADPFVKKSMVFLILACVLRTSISVLAALQTEENWALQQLYFDVPFYAFVPVSAALMASWRQFYRHIR